MPEPPELRQESTGPLEEVDRLKRLFEDQALLEQLRQDGFQGPLWNHFADALAEYGFPVMCAWIFSREVIQRCKDKNIPCDTSWLGDDYPWRREDAEEVACETVAVAINAFRTVLRRGRWSPERGATMLTFFIGQCLMQYSNVFRRWKRENAPSPTVSIEALNQLDTTIDPPDDRTGKSPEKMAIVNDELDHALRDLEPRTRQALKFRALGYSNAEIAELLEVSLSTVERIFHQHRRAFSEKFAQDSNQQALHRQPPAPDGGRIS